MRKKFWLLLGITTGLVEFFLGYSMGPCPSQTRAFIIGLSAILLGIIITVLNKFLSK